MHDNDRQEAEPEIQQAKDRRGHYQLDESGVGWLRGIGRMSGSEYEDLQNEPAHDPRPAISESVTQKGSAGKRNGSEQTLLPKAGLQRNRQRPEPRQHCCQRVRIEQRV